MSVVRHAAEDFDIIRQEYRCRHCEGSVSASEARVKFESWAHEHAELTANGVARHGVGGELACPNCGASVEMHAASDDELMSSKCEHCGTQFVAAPPGKTFSPPDVMIPFFITLDEAHDRLREWCNKNSRRPEAREAIKHIDEMHGCRRISH